MDIYGATIIAFYYGHCITSYRDEYNILLALYTGDIMV